MALAVTITDSGNGVGVATISGTAGGSVSLYSYVFDGTLGALTPVSRGNRVGDGIIALSGLTYPASYMWQVVGSTSVSPVVFQNFVNTAEPTHLLILRAVKDRINGLGFSSWLPSAKIFVRWIPGKEAIRINGTPALYICPVGTEVYDNLTIAHDYPGYPVAIVLVDAANNNSEANLARNLDWRTKTQKALRWQRLAAFTDAYKGELIPDAICDPGAFDKQYLVNAFVMRFFVRETRG